MKKGSITKNAPRFAAVTVFLLLLAVGCSSTRKTGEPEADPAPIPVSFETRKDTVLSSSSGDDQSVQWEGEKKPIRFMVQIGAFRNPQNASQIQSLARERFHVPVLNDYHTESKLYQVRIGFFEDFNSARDFRLQLQSEFPGEYADAWIVQLKD